ncbi:hypothetical protein BGP_6383 [Beggiatoa sp. PS]|nr:hypothetical protein BGP_6383 [Beggiatoa sp. PS]
MGKHRPLRGGSWNEVPKDCRVSSRDWNILVDNRTIGFRVVLIE